MKFHAKPSAAARLHSSAKVRTYRSSSRPCGRRPGSADIQTGGETVSSGVNTLFVMGEVVRLCGMHQFLNPRAWYNDRETRNGAFLMLSMTVGNRTHWPQG